MREWVEPSLWTSKRRVLASDINNQAKNAEHLKEKPCETFCFMGTVGSEIIDLHQQQSIHIDYWIKYIPPGGKVYMREASRLFKNGKLAMQLDGWAPLISPVSNPVWHTDPEYGIGSFNKYDPDIMKTSYWNRTRWSSPVDTGDPKVIDSWHYNDGYGWLMVENPSLAQPCYLEFIMLFRNLTDEEKIPIATGDNGYFSFLITTPN